MPNQALIRRIEGCLQVDRQQRWTAEQVLNALQPPVIQFASSSSPNPQVLTLTLPGDVELEMIKIPAGSFLMGSADNDLDANNDEKPQHPVILQEYYLGKYPVTQEQYQAVMSNNPSHFKDNPKNPVERVSWNDAKVFCEKVYKLTGQKVRLPTEAEWEYACRARTTTPFYFGETISIEQANCNEDYPFGKGRKRIYREKTTPVGSFPANNFGLYDMHGNLWEWCEDNWHDNYEEKPENLKRNGNIAWSSSNELRRVLRGGSWNEESWFCRSAFRVRNVTDIRYNFHGFRLVLSSP